MKWKTELQINEIVSKYNSDAWCDEDLIPDGLIDDIVEELEKQTNLRLRSFAKTFKQCVIVGDFNDTLAELYDYADENGIWLGMPSFG